MRFLNVGLCFIFYVFFCDDFGNAHNLFFLVWKNFIHIKKKTLQKRQSRETKYNTTKNLFFRYCLSTNVNVSRRFSE